MCVAEAGKVTAEQAVHELQLDLRSQVEKYNQLHEARRYKLTCGCVICCHVGNDVDRLASPSRFALLQSVYASKGLAHFNTVPPFVPTQPDNVACLLIASS